MVERFSFVCEVALSIIQYFYGSIFVGMLKLINCLTYYLMTRIFSTMRISLGEFNCIESRKSAPMNPRENGWVLRPARGRVCWV